MTALFVQFWVLVLLAFLGGSIIAVLAARMVFPSAQAIRERASKADPDKARGNR